MLASLAAAALLLGANLAQAQFAPAPAPPAMMPSVQSSPTVQTAQTPANPAPVDNRALRPAAYQPEGTTGDQQPGYRIQTEPPGIERIAIGLQTDESLRERIRLEHKAYGERVEFPASPVLTNEPFRLRSWEPNKEQVAPNYIIHQRLYFHQINFERYGWDLGIITPLLSASDFLFDFVSLPYHAFSDPCRCMDSNAGYCLPGDPVPLMLYPPEISVTGFLAETGAILALVAIFP